MHRLCLRLTQYIFLLISPDLLQKSFNSAKMFSNILNIFMIDLSQYHQELPNKVKIAIG